MKRTNLHIISLVLTFVSAITLFATAISASECTQSYVCPITLTVPEEAVPDAESKQEETVFASSSSSGSAVCYYCGSDNTFADYKYSSYAYPDVHEVKYYCNNCEQHFGESWYEDHSFSHEESWHFADDYSHKRYYRCGICGYDNYEYEDHDFTKEYVQTDDAQHYVKIGCICDPDLSYFEAHDFVYGEWQQDTVYGRHYRTAECSLCEYSTTLYSYHEYTSYTYIPYTPMQHIFKTMCECGFTVATEYESHHDSDGDCLCDMCQDNMNRISVTLPAVMELTVDTKGNVYTSASAMIYNSSAVDVRVTGVTLNTENGWSLVPFETNMADEKTDSKLIGFRINECESTSYGDSETLTLADDWTVSSDGILTLDYGAVVSASSTPIDEQVLTVVFTVSRAV